MTLDESTYFERRAETQLELAQRATHPAAVRAHYQLVGEYLDRVYSAADKGFEQAGSSGL